MVKKIVILLSLYLSTLHATMATQESVAKLYVATFSRAPDAAGLDFWVFNSKLSLENIAKSFFDQPETKEMYPDNTSNLQFIRSIYANLFNRQPAQEGEEYWLDALDTGKVSKSVFILAVVNGALGDDAEILNNKTLVGITYALMDLDDINLARDVMKNVNASTTSVNSALDMIDSYNDGTYSPNEDTSSSIDEQLYSEQPSNEQTNSEEIIDIDSLHTLPLSYEYLSFWRGIVSDINRGSTYSSPSFIYDATPDASSCDMGRVSYGAKDRVLRVANSIRELHGLSLLRYNDDFDHEVQSSSLIMKANNKMSHTPQSNSRCYTEDGYRGSSTSNLSNSNRIVDPAKDIVTWIDDASNASAVSAVGHRRWLLNPFGNYTSYGQIDGWSTLKVFGFNDSINSDIGVDYIAFPYKRYPYILVSNATPWSFSIVETKDDLYSNANDYFSSATITVREKASGKTLNVIKKYNDSIAYGVPNILTWQVSGWKRDTLYEVTISNVQMQNSNSKTFTYDVYIDYNSLQ